jgi:hypothetical protein
MVMEFASRKPLRASDRRSYRRTRSGSDTVNQVWMGATTVAFVSMMVVGAGISLTGLPFSNGIQALSGATGAILGAYAGWAGFARG